VIFGQSKIRSCRKLLIGRRASAEKEHRGQIKDNKMSEKEFGKEGRIVCKQ